MGRHVWIAAAAAACFGCQGAAAPRLEAVAPAQDALATVEVNPGEYWGLPTTYPAKSPYGGLYQIWGPSTRWSPVLDIPWVGGLWRNLNPSEGVYDWNRIEGNGGSWSYG